MLENLRKILDSVPLLVARFDLTGRLVYTNTLFSMMNAGAGCRVDINPAQESAPASDRFAAALRRTLEYGDSEQLDLNFPTLLGQRVAFRITIAAECSADGRPLGAIVFGFDVSDIESYRDQVNSLAFYDGLTGLANRDSFWQQLNSVLAASRDDASTLGVVVMDLDRFSEINAQYGHAVGDLVLQQVAIRLRACVGRTRLVARLGGDEFALLLHTVRRDTDIEAVARNIIGLFQTPFRIGAREIVSSVSVGVSLAPRHGNHGNQLLRLAEIAMYQAKRAGGSTFSFHESPDLK